jgi:hypothetical protein
MILSRRTQQILKDFFAILDVDFVLGYLIWFGINKFTIRRQEKTFNNDHNQSSDCAIGITLCIYTL